ncbi:MAG TPA: hypothetical protein VG711_11665 [Phycisphaerales bacterium]|nr:hypothetical protein [Phycisphaerales bacterium]
MRRTILRLITAIQLTRLTMAFGAISDLWFVILLTQSQKAYYGSMLPQICEMSTWAALALGAIIAVGLFAFGASLNDVLDFRHDSAFSPERPIPAGRIRMGQAIVVTTGALIMAILASVFFWDIGSILVTLLTATGILFYNAAGKHIPVMGFVTVGLVHACHMFIPNRELVFTLPVWLVMSHSMAIAMTVYVLEDKRPKMTRVTIFATAIGWLVWSAILLGAGMNREGRLLPEGTSPAGLVYPMLAVVAFVIVAWWKITGVPNRAGAEKMRRYGAMWQSWYGAAWMMTLGLTGQALLLGLLAVAGFTAMTLIKEITGTTDKPIEYRG